MLARALDSATTFEKASDLTLAAVLDIVQAALDGSEHAKAGNLLRAMLHMRPDDGYLRLVALEATERKAGCHRGEGIHLPSATAWRWVCTHRVPISLDVGLEMVLTLEDGGFKLPAKGSDEAGLAGSRLKLA